MQVTDLLPKMKIRKRKSAASVSVLSYMKYPQPLGWEIADVERLEGSCSEYDGAVAHARGGSEGSQGCREDADDDLQDGLPSFFLHGAFMVFLG